MAENINISDKDRTSLDSLKERVWKHVYPFSKIQAIAAGDMPPAGEYNEFVEQLDCGIRIVFTFEIQKDGFHYRHAAISVYNEDKYLNTFQEPFVFAHFRENILRQTVYRMGIDPAGVYPMKCWGEKGEIPALHYLQRITDLDASGRS